MPEGLEAEIWRRDLEPLVGRRISRVEVDERSADPRIVRLVDADIIGVRRHGKVVLVDTSDGVIGLRFGMTGRVVVDGRASIESLAYASGADRPGWDRLRLWTDGDDATPAIRLSDPRRLGRVELDPDLGRLGPDLFDLDTTVLARVLAGRNACVKAALMNQEVIAGLGNLCVDEVLFHASLDPRRSAADLGPAELGRLQRAIDRRLPAMLVAGGSTEGVLDPTRRADLGPCPRRGCAGVLRRVRLGGRTTVFCGTHQVEPMADC